MSTTVPELTVDVRELLRSPGASRQVHLERTLTDIRTPMVRVDPDIPTVVDARIENVVDGLLVTGEVHATLRVQCVRCLTEISQPLDVEVQELFARSLADAKDDDEPGYVVLPGEILPLDTMVRDALVLSFPSSPLCRPDCAGLCPQCGADRNTVACGHGEGAVDPRWQPLADLQSLSNTQEEGHDARPEA